MNICSDPKAEYSRHPEDDSYYLSFEVFYNNPTDTASVRLRMPCGSTARALCNFLKDHAVRPPQVAEEVNRETPPAPLDPGDKAILSDIVARVITLENENESRRNEIGSERYKQDGINRKFRNDIGVLDNARDHLNKELKRVEETIRLAYNARKQQSDRVDALAGEVKELERLRALMATHVTSLYSQIESQRDDLAQAVHDVIKPDRIADPERIDKVLAQHAEIIKATSNQVSLHEEAIQRLLKKWCFR